MDQMSETKTALTKILKKKSGQGLVEYCLILLLVTMVIILALQGFGTTVKTSMYDRINSAVTSASK